jgi:hypothetical protein
VLAARGKRAAHTFTQAPQSGERARSVSAASASRPAVAGAKSPDWLLLAPPLCRPRRTSQAIGRSGVSPDQARRRDADRLRRTPPLGLIGGLSCSAPPGRPGCSAPRNHGAEAPSCIPAPLPGRRKGHGGACKEQWAKPGPGHRHWSARPPCAPRSGAGLQPGVSNPRNLSPHPRARPEGAVPAAPRCIPARTPARVRRTGASQDARTSVAESPLPGALSHLHLPCPTVHAPDGALHRGLLLRRPCRA